jgi:hypothetical protein
MEDALQALEENLAEIGARVTGKGVCTSLEPHQSILEVRN